MIAFWKENNYLCTGESIIESEKKDENNSEMGTKWHILFFKYLPFLKVNINVKFWSQQTYNILRHLASSLLLAEIFYLLINALMCMGTCMAYFCISVHIALWLFWSHVATSLVYQLLSLILADWSNLLQIYHHFLFHEMFKCCLTWISYIIIDIVNSVYQLLQSSSYSMFWTCCNFSVTFFSMKYWSAI